jgi:hypothetical protein
MAMRTELERSGIPCVIDGRGLSSPRTSPSGSSSRPGPTDRDSVVLDEMAAAGYAQIAFSETWRRTERTATPSSLSVSASSGVPSSRTRCFNPGDTDMTASSRHQELRAEAILLWTQEGSRNRGVEHVAAQHDPGLRWSRHRTR